MKSLKLKMTFEEYDTMPWRFGWKHEYWDGYARVTPRYDSILVKMSVKPRAVETAARIVNIEQISVKNLEKLFFDSFVETVEYCDYKRADVKKSAAKNIEKFFSGERGEPVLELSCAAILDDELAGAALITKRKYGVKLEILFVQPKFHGKNIATALAATVLNDLSARGVTAFWSEHRACNQPSARWHQTFGFEEVPDLRIAQMRYYYFKHEVWRLEKLGENAELGNAKTLLKKAEIEYEKLEEVRKSEGFEAAHIMWKYD